MDSELILIIVTITLALVFYTIGVFGERKARDLNKKHVIIFQLGLIFDTTGTLTMSRIAEEGIKGISEVFQVIRGVTGLLAAILMLSHALWVTWVLYKNDERKKATFHKFSTAVWLVWLVPYMVGMITGMM